MIENRKIWKRIVEENKIIGYLEWEKNFDNLLSEKSEVKTKKADSTKTVYHISSKKIKAQIIFPVSNDIKTYDSAESILKNNFEVSDFSEEYYLADEVISFNIGKFVHVTGENNNQFVNISDIKVLESFYLESLPEEIRHNISVFDNVFISMGRLSPEKNQSSLIKAVKKLIDRGYDVKLLILGKGPLKKELTLLITRIIHQDKQRPAETAS